MDPRLERPRWERAWAAVGSVVVGLLAARAYSDFCDLGFGDSVRNPVSLAFACGVGVLATWHCFIELGRMGYFLDGPTLVLVRLAVWGFISCTVAAAMGMFFGSIIWGGMAGA